MLARIPHIPAKDLTQHVGEEVTVIGWLVTEKIISTKKGEPMEFVTLEDQTSLYDATLFPNTYRRYCHLLATNQAYVVTGLVEEQFSTVTLTVRELRLLASPDVSGNFQSIEEVARVAGTLLAMPLSPLIRFGTSTWTYEGWQGQVYKKPVRQEHLCQGLPGRVLPVSVPRRTTVQDRGQ